MQEQATLNYIKNIAGNDPSYETKLIGIIKAEFPKEKAQFLTSYEKEDLIATAEIVHKLKHKINIFGLEKGYEIARDFENQLKNQKTELYPKFILILDHIENYLQRL